jgi:hypothetical protein
MLQTAMYATEMARKSHTQVMKSGRFCASLMKAPRLEDRKDYAHSLPPGEAIDVYPVDALPGSPDEWVRGPGSYVCPVAPDWGLWFDWRGNDRLNTAIVASVKGLNPISGQKIEGIRMQQFKDECPVHKVKFKGERYCEKCDYVWPPQDYVASPNTLWWDGFRQPDGCVRQFFFSEDQEKDIASTVMGERNTVPAFGFAFFEPLKRREAPPETLYRGGGGMQMMYCCNSIGIKGLSGDCGESGAVELCSFDFDDEPQYAAPGAAAPASAAQAKFLLSDQVKCSYNVVPAGASKIARSMHAKSQVPEGAMLSKVDAPRMSRSEPRKVTAKVAVGAGARIRQDLTQDPLALSDWKPEASEILRLYFVFREKFAAIADKGVLDLSGNKEGYLKDLPVG